MIGISGFVEFLQRDSISPNHLKSLVVVLGITSIGVASYFYRKWLANRPPKSWRLVGEIGEIFCYPIKSCAPMRITNNIQCTKLGLQNGVLRERVFVIVTKSYATLSAQPKLLLIQPNITGDTLIISAPSMPDFHLNISQLYQTEQTITHSHHPSGTIDCGAEVAAWLSKFISGNEDGYRLVFYPDNDLIRNDRNERLKLESTGLVQLPNEFQGFMMLNAESVNDLNTRIEEPVVPLIFRPNFVVKGASAYDEDNWKWVRIGDNLTFKYTGPCLRCYVVTMDPTKGVLNKGQEPLKTLKSYRCVDTCKSPVMGMYLLLMSNGGSVRSGDAVYVGCDG
ncbi:hypothetical protein HA402_010517 [Bradysia odoriphaga]|nr:hypothetical protein HA402_010517 [Bradysia odoriphaga]